MEFQNDKKNKKPRKFSPWWIRIFALVVITSAAITVLAFFTGRTIANEGSDELRMEFYTFLKGSPFEGCISIFFDENTLPDTSPILPDCVKSESDGIIPLFVSDNEALIELTPDEGNFNARIFALKNPSRIVMGKSSFDHNYISEIMNIRNADYAFSASDDRSEKIIVADGEYTENASGGFFGITKGGIISFGNIEDFDDVEDRLLWAQAADIHTLVCGSVPTCFSPSANPIGIPSLSIGQCADGSVILIIADRNASVNDITRLFYKYSAVNAAIVYIGESSGMVYSDRTNVSYGSDFEDAQYSYTWLIK